MVADTAREQTPIAAGKQWRAQSRGGMCFSRAYCMDVASYISRIIARLGSIQSDAQFHFLPSHCWMRTMPPPSWSAQDRRKGGMKPSKPIAARRCGSRFSASNPSRTWAPVIGRPRP